MAGIKIRYDCKEFLPNLQDLERTAVEAFLRQNPNVVVIRKPSANTLAHKADAVVVASLMLENGKMKHYALSEKENNTFDLFKAHPYLTTIVDEINVEPGSVAINNAEPGSAAAGPGVAGGKRKNKRTKRHVKKSKKQKKTKKRGTRASLLPPGHKKSKKQKKRN